MNPLTGRHKWKNSLSRPMLRPTVGWLWAAAGVVGSYIIAELHAPLPLAFLTLAIFLVAALLWPWAHLTTKRKWFFRSILLAYVVVTLICTATLRAKRTPEQTKLEQVLLGQEYDPQKLSSQFPLGYVVFRLENNDKLEFYKGLSLIENYDFDWSAVKYISNNASDFKVHMPDVVPKTPHGVRITGNIFGGPKRVGFWFLYYETADFRIIEEVLDVDKDGVVFVIGLMKSKSKQQ